MPGRPAFVRPARSYGTAAAILAQRDPVLQRLFADAGPARLSRSTETHFAALVRAIVYQQLAGPAVRAIHGRLVTALAAEITPERLLTLDDATLRVVGLSANKVLSLAELYGGTAVSALTPSMLAAARATAGSWPGCPAAAPSRCPARAAAGRGPGPGARTARGIRARRTAP